MFRLVWLMRMKRRGEGEWIVFGMVQDRGVVLELNRGWRIAWRITAMSMVIGVGNEETDYLRSTASESSCSTAQGRMLQCLGTRERLVDNFEGCVGGPKVSRLRRKSAFQKNRTSALAQNVLCRRLGTKTQTDRGNLTILLAFQIDRCSTGIHAPDRRER